MSQSSSKDAFTQEDVEAFIKERSAVLEEDREKELFQEFEEARKSYRERIAEKTKKTYKDSLWSMTSERFGSKKVIYVGGDSSESESDEKVVHNYVHCEDSYIQAPENVIKIEGKHDEVIKKLVTEGRKKFSNKIGYDMLITVISKHYNLTKKYILQVLNEPIESTSVVRTSSEVSEACSSSCFKILKGERNGNTSLSVSDETEIKLQLLSLDGDHCSNAQKLNKPCNVIYTISKQMASTSFNNTYQKSKKMKMQLVNNQVFNLYKKRDEQYEGLAAMYKPCNHEGECDKNCPCFKGKNYCEVFCSCKQNCKNKFRGCVCKARCETKSCPCFAAIRECIVGQCGCKPSTTNEGTCTNMKIQSKLRSKIEIKRSNVSGYGAFAGEDITKGDFVVEYTGELITQEEAEIRGKMYDETRMSYLFDLSCDYAVDGKFIGNESRFINHSGESPNCSVKTMTVLGNKRIALYASRNIKKGEELFFNYRYNDEQKRIYFEKKN